MLGSKSHTGDAERERYRICLEALKGPLRLSISPNPLANTNRARINDLALSARMPTITAFESTSRTGGLIRMAKHPTFRRAGD